MPRTQKREFRNRKRNSNDQALIRSPIEPFTHVEPSDQCFPIFRPVSAASLGFPKS